MGRIERILRKAGRKRYVTATVTAVRAALTSQQLTARPATVPGYAASAVALVNAITALAAQVDQLGEQVEQSFGRHPDANLNTGRIGVDPQANWLAHPRQSTGDM